MHSALPEKIEKIFHHNLISNSTLTLTYIQRCLENMMQEMGISAADAPISWVTPVPIRLWFTAPELGHLLIDDHISYSEGYHCPLRLSGLPAAHTFFWVIPQRPALYFTFHWVIPQSPHLISPFTQWNAIGPHRHLVGCPQARNVHHCIYGVSPRATAFRFRCLDAFQDR